MGSKFDTAVTSLCNLGNREGYISGSESCMYSGGDPLTVMKYWFFPHIVPSNNT